VIWLGLFGFILFLAGMTTERIMYDQERQAILNQLGAQLRTHQEKQIQIERRQR